MSDVAKIVLFVLLVVALIVLGPFLAIWALNTLFPVLNIPYNFETWLAVILVKGLVTAKVNVNKG